MDLDVKRMVTFQNEGAVKAVCDIELSGDWLIRSLRIVDGRNGLFVSMPRFQTKKGEWIDMVSPLKPELRDQINTSLLAYYEEHKEDPQHVSRS